MAMAASTRHPFCLGLYFVTSQTLSPTVESFAPRVWLSFWLVPANRIYWKSWFPGFTPGPQKVCVLTGGRETCGTEPNPPPRVPGEADQASGQPATSRLCGRAKPG